MTGVLGDAPSSPSLPDFGERLRRFASELARASGPEVFKACSAELAAAEEAVRRLQAKVHRAVLLESFRGADLGRDALSAVLRASGVGKRQVSGLLLELDRDAGAFDADGRVDADILVEWLLDGGRRRARLSLDALAAAPCAGAPLEELEARALSVHYITTTFLEHAGAAGPLETLKVYDIEEKVLRGMSQHVLCPRDGRPGAAYVDNVDGEDNVGKATHMLSYTWGYNLQDIASALSMWCERNGLDPKRSYVWMCCVCVNQHRVKEAQRRKEVVPFERFKDVFEGRVRSIGNVICLMMPWRSPAYLTRAWCMYELFTAVSMGKENCTVSIVMPPKEEQSFVASVVSSATDGSEVNSIFRTLAKVSIEHSKASVPEDRENIYRLVKEGIGVYDFDEIVKNEIRHWFMRTACDHIENLPYKFLRTCLTVSRMMSNANWTIGATGLLEFCWRNSGMLTATPFGTGVTTQPGVAPEFVARLFYQRGRIRFDHGMPDTAIEILTAGIAEAESSGSSGVGLSRLYRGRARCLAGDEPDTAFRDGGAPDAAQLRRAIADFRHCEEILERNGKLESEDAAKLFCHASSAHIVAGDDEAALRCLDRCERIRVKRGTLEHPSNGKRLYYLGSLHLRRYRCGEAEDLVEEWRRAKQALEESKDIAHRVFRLDAKKASVRKLEWLAEHAPQGVL